jgi:ubiquitin related modifier 1
MAATSAESSPSAPTLDFATDAPVTAAPARPNAQPSVNLTVEFTGGLEILFNNVSRHRVTLPATVPASTRTVSKSSLAEPTTVGYLIKWLLENLLQDPRKELFVVDGTV